LPKRRLSIEVATLFYALAYLPYVVITRRLATIPDPTVGRPWTGLEILPALQFLAMVMTWGFMALAGWTRTAHRIPLGSWRIPFATRWTFLSGVCTALILVTVPLSYTFTDVSIPLMQLLMRGDILIVAPLVDVLSRRRVRWWSWGALALVGLAMVISFQSRDDKGFPLLAIATVVLYTIGYFGRLYVMSRVAKTDDPDLMRRYFSEEKIVGFPVSLLLLLVLALAFGGSQSGELSRGFVAVWTSPQLGWIALCSLAIAITGVLSAVILLDSRENSFCVPLERSASILAGLFGSLILALLVGGKMPSGGEMIGAVLLIGALALLSIAPRFAGRQVEADAEQGS
jgi:hypothetical protein